MVCFTKHPFIDGCLGFQVYIEFYLHDIQIQNCPEKKKMIEVGWCCRQGSAFFNSMPQRVELLNSYESWTRFKKGGSETAPFEYGWEVGANVISRSRFMRYMFLMICIDVYTMSSMYAFIQCWWFFQLYKVTNVVHNSWSICWPVIFGERLSRSLEWVAFPGS